MTESDHIYTPWDEQTVQALNIWQIRPDQHPFTCPQSPHGRNPERSLTATADGWCCPGCGYEQYWAWAFMAAPIAEQMHEVEAVFRIVYRGNVERRMREMFGDLYPGGS